MKQTKKVRFAILVSLVLSSPLVLFSQARAADSASLYLSPASGIYGSGDVIKVAIHENSGQSTVNAAHVSLTYSDNNLDFVSIASSAGFNINVPSSGSNGLVKIDRGALPAVSGDQIIAIVSFKVTATSGTANINVGDDSKVLSATTNTNILGPKTGASYSFDGMSKNPPPASLATKPSSGSTGSAKTTTSDSAFDITNISVSDIGLNSAVVSWSTPVASSSEVDYGQGAYYALSAVDSSLVTTHSLRLSTDAGEPYHYIIKSVDGSGRTATTVDMSFHSKGVNLNVEVVNPQNQPLKGAVVAYSNKLGTTIIEKSSVSTNKKGQATLYNLPVGTKTPVSVVVTASFRGKVLSSKVQIQPIANAGTTQNTKITLKEGANFGPILLGLGGGLAFIIVLYGVHYGRRRAAETAELGRHFPKLPGTGPKTAGPRIITPQIPPGGSTPESQQTNNRGPWTGLRK